MRARPLKPLHAAYQRRAERASRRSRASCYGLVFGLCLGAGFTGAFVTGSIRGRSPLSAAYVGCREGSLLLAPGLGAGFGCERNAGPTGGFAIEVWRTKKRISSVRCTSLPLRSLITATTECSPRATSVSE